MRLVIKEVPTTDLRRRQDLSFLEWKNDGKWQLPIDVLCCGPYPSDKTCIQSSHQSQHAASSRSNVNHQGWWHSNPIPKLDMCPCYSRDSPPWTKMEWGPHVLVTRLQEHTFSQLRILKAFIRGDDSHLTDWEGARFLRETEPVHHECRSVTKKTRMLG
jgi:hypothetical protein